MLYLIFLATHAPLFTCCSIIEQDTVIFTENDIPEKFELVKKGSQRGGDILVSSKGYSFAVKRKSKSSVTWRCSVRNKKVYCPVTIIETDKTYTQKQEHTHEAIPGKLAAVKLVKEVCLHYTVYF